MWSIIRYTVLSLTSAAHNTSSEPVPALPTAAASCCHPNAVTSTPPHHSLLPLCPQFTKQQSVFPVHHSFPFSPIASSHSSHRRYFAFPSSRCVTADPALLFPRHYVRLPLQTRVLFPVGAGGALPREQCPRSSSVSASFRHSARPKPTPVRRDPRRCRPPPPTRDPRTENSRRSSPAVPGGRRLRGKCWRGRPKSDGFRTSDFSSRRARLRGSGARRSGAQPPHGIP